MRLLTLGFAARCTIAVFAAGAAPVAMAQDQRENMVLQDNGSLLRVTSSGNSSGIVRRDRRGAETAIISNGDTVLDGSLHGIGSNPAMNVRGDIAFKATFGSYGSHVLFATNRNGLTPLVVSRTNGGGTAILGDTVCGIEPTPEINARGQVGFGADLDVGGNSAGGTECGDTSTPSIARRKGIFRSGRRGVDTMIRSDRLQPLTEVFVPASSGMVSMNTTFDLADVDFVHMGARVMNDSGQMLVDAYLDADVTTDSGPAIASHSLLESDDQPALLRLNSPGRFDVVAVAGPPGQSMFQEVGGGVINNFGGVLFKAEQRSSGSGCGFKNGSCSSTGATSQLYRWFGPGALIQVAASGGAIPGSTDVFHGFTPHFDFNNNGNAAFVGGISTDDRPGVYFATLTGNITEIARVTSAGPGAGASSFDGFDFDTIASVAVLSASNHVFFIAENSDSDGDCSNSVYGGQRTAIFRWHAREGLREVVREGAIVDGRRILRLYVIPPELRDHTNRQGAFVVLADSDPSGGCTSTASFVVQWPQGRR